MVLLFGSDSNSLPLHARPEVHRHLGTRCDDDHTPNLFLRCGNVANRPNVTTPAVRGWKVRDMSALDPDLPPSTRSDAGGEHPAVSHVSTELDLPVERPQPARRSSHIQGNVCRRFPRGIHIYAVSEAHFWSAPYAVSSTVVACPRRLLPLQWAACRHLAIKDRVLGIDSL